MRSSLDTCNSDPETEQDVTAFGSRLVTVQRAHGTRQTATDAAVYILHLPPVSHAAIIAELEVHLAVLRTNNAVILVLTGRLLPEPESSSLEVEATARSRDLAMRQLSNEGEMELADLLNIIDTPRDSVGGKLVVVDKLCSRTGTIIALVVRYQADLDRL